MKQVELELAVARATGETTSLIRELARKASASITDVAGVVIFGNHSATMYPSVEAATIRGRPLTAAIPGVWLQGEFVTTVAKRGDAIIQARGRSSAASAAQALIDHVRSLVRPNDGINSVAVVSAGDYGLATGVWAGLPLRTTAPGQWHVVPDLPIGNFGMGKLAETNAELLRERDLALGYGFIDP